MIPHEIEATERIRSLLHDAARSSSFVKSATIPTAYRHLLRSRRRPPVPLFRRYQLRQPKRLPWQTTAPARPMPEPAAVTSPFFL